METLANKVLLITGASTGIGGFTAKYLSKYKPKLALVARSTDKLQEVKKQCEAAGAGKGNVLTITADMAKLDDVSKALKETVNQYGQLDTLVNNAAAFAINDIETTKPETFDRIMAVNLKAPFFLSQIAMPFLKKSKGSIVNISSVAAQRAVVDVAAYCVSKAALEHLTRLLALELAPEGVRCNAITVGGTMTDTQSESLQLLGNDLMYELSDLKKIQPLGGTCSMEDVAKVVGFLASDLSSAMTGTAIPVDRGSLIVPPAQPEAVSETLAAMKNMGDFNPVATQIRMEQIAVMAKGGKPAPPRI